MEAYAAFRAISQYREWHDFAWSCDTWANSILSDGLRWAFSWLPDWKDIAAEWLDYLPLTVALQLQSFQQVNEIPFLLQGALDAFYFDLNYLSGSLPQVNDILNDCDLATGKLATLSGQWLNAFDGVTLEEKTSLIVQIDAAVSSLTVLKQELSQIAVNYGGLNDRYQARGSGAPGSSDEGDKKAEVLLNAMKGMLWYDYSIGAAPVLDESRSPLPRMIAQLSAQKVILGPQNQVCFFPVADTVISHNNPTANYGGDTRLRVVRNISSEVWARDNGLVRFDTSILPSGRSVEVTNVVLHLTCVESSINASLWRHSWGLMLFRMDSYWNEMTATAVACPSADGESGEVLASVDYPDVWLPAPTDFVLTSADNPGLLYLVQQWIDHPEQNFGCLLVGASENYGTLEFVSRESGTNQCPRLTVQYRTPPVNRAPTVQLNSLANGAVVDVNEDITFSWTVSDLDGDTLANTFYMGLSEADMYGEAMGVATELSGAFNPPPEEVLPVTLYWRVTTKDHNWATESEVRHLTLARIPPSVSMLSPHNGDIFEAGQPMSLSASASDRGSMDRVEFYIDEQLVGTARNTPYDITVTAPSGNGTHSVCAIAYDQSGSSATSAIVNVTTKQLAVSTTSLPHGMELVPYSATLQATNGTPPYMWSISPQIVGWDGNENGQATPPAGLADVKVIAAGGRHSLALKSDGTVVGWGYNENGQATPPAGVTDVMAVAVGDYHSLALKSDGTVVGWGGDWNGQSSPPAGLTDVIAVSAGWAHSLALKSDGTVVGWGQNGSGQATPPGGLTNVIAVAAGTHHSLALKSDGTVVGWGSNDYNGQSMPPEGLMDVIAVCAGQYHSLALKSDGTVVGWGANWSGQATPPEGLTNVIAVAAGISHSLALKIDGTVVGWGSTALPADLKDVTAVSAGWSHSLALRSAKTQLPMGMRCSADGVISGTPVQAGTNSVVFVVQDSTGSSATKALEIVVSPNTNTRPVVDSAVPPQGKVSMEENSGQVFSVMAHDPEGQALTYAWIMDGVLVGGDGSNYLYSAPWGAAGIHKLRCAFSDDLWTNAVFAEWRISVEDIPIAITNEVLPSGKEMVPYSASLQATNGVSPYTWSAMPRLCAWGANWDGQLDMPPGIDDVVAISAGYHNLALKSDGAVVAWGANWSGQADVPPGLAGVKAVAAGSGHSLALKSDGTVVAWGENWDGATAVPEGLSSVIGIAGGYGHSLALLADGTVVAWGSDSDGQTDVPSGLSNVSALAAGNSHSVALKSNGTVVVWGGSWYGATNIPTDLCDVTAIAAGGYHNLALKKDGTVVAWGANWYGQATVPSTLVDVVGIAAGSYYSLALKSDGTVVAWGDNWYGETTLPSGLSGVKMIVAGCYHSLALRADGKLLPEGLACSSDGVVGGTPTLAATNVVTFVVRDSLGATTNKAFEILIAPNPNTRPVISSNAPPAGAITMGEGTNRSFQVWAYDPEGSNLTYLWTWDGSPVGGNTSSYTQPTTWGDAGQHVLCCYVSDDLWTNIVHTRWNVTVLADNDGDGMPNWQEIDLGRNPNDPNDAGAPSSLSGTIRGAGIGLVDAYLELRGSGGTIYNSTRTDGSGSYTINGILPGTYRVKAGAEHFADEWYQNVTHRTNAAPYSVPANTVIGGFDFDLEPGQNPALLEVTSDPSGAEIYLDFQPVSLVTPAVVDVGEVGCWDAAGLRIASHVITLKKDGRPRPAPRTVAAREAETVSVHFDLTSNATGSISVVSMPDGATVFVDYADASEGISPVAIDNLAPGSHVVLLKKQDFLQPRPIIVGVEEGTVSEIAIPLTTNAATDRMLADVHSIPPGATIYVDYLPTTNVTDAVIGWLDPASPFGYCASGSLWIGASHTIMLRKNGSVLGAPRFVPERVNETHVIRVHLITDTVTAQDQDSDSLPDQWEDAYRLRELAPQKHGKDDDPDGDGATNDEELRAGTNPLDKNSCLRLTDLDMTKSAQDNLVTFVFGTVPGRTYLVQGADSLTSTWANLSGFIVATSDHTAFTAQVPADTPLKFFRLVVLVP